MGELELTGFHSVPKSDEIKIEALLNECVIVPLSHELKLQYKNLRRAYKLQRPVLLDIPLLTADKQFKTIKYLKLFQYERQRLIITILLSTIGL